MYQLEKNKINFMLYIQVTPRRHGDGIGIHVSPIVLTQAIGGLPLPTPSQECFAHPPAMVITQRGSHESEYCTRKANNIKPD